MSEELKNLISDITDDDEKEHEVLKISPNRSLPISNTSPKILWYIHTCSLIFLTVQQTLQPLLVRKAHNEAEKADTPIVDSTIHLDATVFSITYQLRILTTALLTVLILKRVFSNVQWGALVVSLIGVIFVQMSNRQSPTTIEEKYSDQFIGLTTVLAMCWMSAFAGVYLEGVFKNSTCDIWLQNIRLIGHDIELLEENGFFYGWNWLVWLIANSSAISGIVVAVVMKYADNIKKSYCQSIALGGTALLSVASGDVQATFLLFSGVSLVILSVFLYSLYPPSKVKPKNVVITVNLKPPIQIRSELI
uniref:CMP-sialic acid transporter n=1 Tax=Panagrolaimus sp. PS1159 TaxID=55785 RepID=A0AC35G7W0_9BILA